MQQPVIINSLHRFPLPSRCRRQIWVVLLALSTLPGCTGDIENTPGAPRPFTGASLTLRCPDTHFAAAIRPAVHSWATRTGATVTIRTEPMAIEDDTDIGIIPTSDLGLWAEREQLLPVPAGIRAADHPYQWTGVLPTYREQLIEWGGQARALPLAGDGHLIVYRADRVGDAKFVEAFRKSYGRAPGAPASWEEFADLAAAFAAFDNKPSLAPLAGSDLADLFFRVAACYDRLAVNDAAIARRGSKREDLQFQFDLTSGDPRLGAPSFIAAADWLGGLSAKKCFAPAPAAGASNDPVAALADGRAALAVLSLGQLARLPRVNGVVATRFALAPLPGTRKYLDSEKGALIAAATPNYIPYFGGGRLGVVRTRCANADAAFDLIADLGGPARSMEILANTALGAGPFRTAHLDRDHLLIWLGYGFDLDRTKSLRDALELFVRQEVKNPVYGLRGPDQAPLNAAVAESVTKIAAGATTTTAMKELLANWNRIDEKTARDTRIHWRRLSAGLN